MSLVIWAIHSLESSPAYCVSSRHLSNHSQSLACRASPMLVPVVANPLPLSILSAFHIQQHPSSRQLFLLRFLCSNSPISTFFVPETTSPPHRPNSPPPRLHDGSPSHTPALICTSFRSKRRRNPLLLLPAPRLLRVGPFQHLHRNKQHRKWRRMCI